MSNSSGGGSNQVIKFFAQLGQWIQEVIGSAEFRRAFGFIPGVSFISQFQERANKLSNYYRTHPFDFGRSFPIVYNGLVLGDLPDDDRTPPELRDLQANPSQFIADSIGFALSDPQASEGFQALGAAIYDASVAAITGKQLPRNSEAAERARQFVGFVTALGLVPQGLSAAVEVGSLGQIDKIGDNIAQVYFNLGLGFLTWQTMAPILEAAILGPLTEDIQSQYRGKRFSRTELQDLFALGKITRDDLRKALVKLGWPDADIDNVINLAYTNLSRSDIIDMWHSGIFDAPETAKRLRGLGYNPADVDLILRQEVRSDVKADRDESISVLTRSFREGLLPEAEFRAILSEQNYTDHEIDLRVQLIRFEQENDKRKLSVAQLHDAWDQNVIGDQEVKFNLAKLEYDPGEIDTILATWKADKVPDFLRINQSTILEMYRFGIFDRARTLKELQGIGYTDIDAAALVALTEAKFPETFGGAPPKKQKILSLGAVTDLFGMGRLTEDDLRKWAEITGFKDADITLMIDLIKERARTPDRPLSQGTITDAYLSGIFDRTVASNALRNLGFSIADADTILKVTEQENPAVFNPGSITSVRQPTITALVTAVQSGFISELEFYQKAAQIGYTREGAQLYLENAKSRLVKGTKQLSKTDILEFFRKNLMVYSDARDALEKQGYAPQDADLLLRAEQKGIANTDIWAAMISGLLDPDSAFTALIGLGFTAEDITAALTEAGLI